ncbi:type II 3-dehydroquinate dehydratase [Glutamicibacter bergerei]|jgi:3-dehydroquinate dehydratase-2|uniref:3-dehydroquinate dehydratase n=2 Tax=Glutamicibacter TaxID=1742989 RepID=A0ABV9MJX3_9MICC|nr:MULTISPECIES: type II 3-dehydroquinate dehydratase [Glutamicibacter]PCC32673.1 type II 3-dehydroquinate dehydratase [Glutamicibacter sp. BW77]GGJ59996.1 3-dehydroquinate dehydratase [Glutamicibacter ardleyensis]HBV10485.1 type II 3-dehydroquinate dehydratase [Micrococcaceae bacterium]
MTYSAKRTILLLNGPNLNLLGTREPEIYGHDTLADVERLAMQAAAEQQLDLEALQSNHEGVLIDAIHEARLSKGGIIINPGAFTHTSVAIADALSGVSLPVVEVHISNVHQREAFRHHSYVSAVASSIIIGAGVNGYRLAVQQMAHLLSR